MNRSEHISANLWLCAILNNIFQCMLKQLASSKPGKNVILDTCYSHGQQHMQSIIIKMLQQLWQELTRIRAMDILSFLHVSNWQCKMLTYCVLNIASWGSCITVYCMRADLCLCRKHHQQLQCRCLRRNGSDAHNRLQHHTQHSMNA